MVCCVSTASTLMIADCTMFIVIGLFISSVWYVAHAECFLPLDDLAFGLRAGEGERPREDRRVAAIASGPARSTIGGRAARRS